MSALGPSNSDNSPSISANSKYPTLASGSNSTSTSTSLCGPKSSRNTEPNSDSFRIRRRRQKSAIAHAGNHERHSTLRDYVRDFREISGAQYPLSTVLASNAQNRSESGSRSFTRLSQPLRSGGFGSGSDGLVATVSAAAPAGNGTFSARNRGQ